MDTDQQAVSIPAEEQNLVYNLKTIKRIFHWPMIDTTWKQGTEVYDKIKGKILLLQQPNTCNQSHYWLSPSGYNQFSYWSFNMVENTATKAFTITLPVVNKFGTQIKFVDENLNIGLKKIEKTIPIVKDPPKVIFQVAKGAFRTFHDQQSNEYRRLPIFQRRRWILFWKLDRSCGRCRTWIRWLRLLTSLLIDSFQVKERRRRKEVALSFFKPFQDKAFLMIFSSLFCCCCCSDSTPGRSFNACFRVNELHIWQACTSHLRYTQA